MLCGQHAQLQVALCLGLIGQRSEAVDASIKKPLSFRQSVSSVAWLWRHAQTEFCKILAICTPHATNMAGRS